MKLEWSRRYTTIAIYAFLVTAASILFLVLLFNFTYFKSLFYTLIKLLTPFIYGFVIAYILNPILVGIEKKLLPYLFKDKVSPRGRRWIGIILTYAIAAFILTVFLSTVMPQLAVSLSGIVSKIPDYVNQIDRLLKETLSFFSENGLSDTVVTPITETITNFVTSLYQLLTRAIPFIADATMRFSTGVMNLIIGIIISIYMFLDKELFFAQTKRVLNSLFNPNSVAKVIDFTHESHSIFSGFINGKILDSLIIGVLCFISLTILGMPSAMLVSFIVGVTNVIPYFGPFIGAIPSFFIIFIDNPTKAFIFAVFILVLQQFDGNILGPKILGESTGLSAFWVIFAIMVFGGLLGILGMFIGVPLFAVIYMAINRYIDYLLQKKKMPTEVSAYCSEDNKLL